MTTITDNQRNFTEALMLAIVAPDEKKYEKAMGLASEISKDLSEKDIEYSKMGIEVCMEYLKEFL
jgi:hypothetical protein